ncbi:hypothetical protein ABIB25_004374 [Nakamurella sp. UYEF19]|uniref:HD domain-containing protein n=1 Tax=Nakamurella sp. UYEF19 TaxID=1756392 RepID=UPI00339B9787
MDIAVDLPGSVIVAGALALATEAEHPAILHHSIRTFLYARHDARTGKAERQNGYDEELLFVACVLHDVGTSDTFDGAQRFEVEGADAAAAYLRPLGLPDVQIDAVWEAIALHTSPGIAERRGPLTRLTRSGVLTDFGRATAAASGLKADVEKRYPRLEVERVLAGRVVAQALRHPAKAPGSSWPGGLLRAHLADPSAPGLNAGF